ncbi:MAG TPA: hypothetical protein VGD58_11025 [Herpetosiphonaceae bacterium]
MTLTVTLDLPPDVEAELRKSIARQDTERIRQVLLDALAPTIETLLQEFEAPVADDTEWEALADQLIDSVATAAPDDLPVLSDYATSRVGIYEEHP